MSERRRKAGGRLLALLAFPVLLSCPTRGPGPLPVDAEGGRAYIAEGLSLIDFGLLMSRVSVEGAGWVPLAWASAEASGGDKEGLPGTLPVPGWMRRYGEGRLAVWAGHEGAFGDAVDGRADNDEFRWRLLEWLLSGKKSLGFTAAHGEWLRSGQCSAALEERLRAAGVVIADIAVPLDASVLSGRDLVVVGNPWEAFSASELDALASWLEGGGSLLVLGLGWSWEGSGVPDMDSYPVNALGERLGFSVRSGWISDPAAPSGTVDKPAFSIRPLVEYHPLRLRILRSGVDQPSEVAALAAADPESLFVIEGERMGLALPAGLWSSLSDPEGSLAVLDDLYDAELALCGAVNPPFGGEIVWIVPGTDPEASWWLHSGNPIVYRPDAAAAEIVPRLNQGLPGWGIAHEQGHNMHGSTCANLFVPAGTGETWPNVFVLWAYRERGWDWTAQMGADLLDAGHAYHALAEPGFGDLLADPFIFLGCLDLVTTRYGWEGMRSFLTAAATVAERGATASDDAERVAFMVEGLSDAYALDFSPLFSHWGFAVSAATAAATSVQPSCDIAW